MAMSVPWRRKPWSTSEVTGLDCTARQLAGERRSVTLVRDGELRVRFHVLQQNEADWKLAGCQITSVTALSEHSRRFLADDGSPSLRIEAIFQNHDIISILFF